MGSQFSAFLTAVYRLYEEKNIKHTHWPRKHLHFKHEYPYDRQDKKHLLTSTIYWDEEGFFHIITLTRHCDDDIVKGSNAPDPINILIKSGHKSFHYTVDGRDLCYAVAKGCTEAIKKYGLVGYRESSGMQYPGDTFDLYELLFVKAYALNAMESREMQTLWSHPDGLSQADASVFEKELSVLLFDM